MIKFLSIKTALHAWLFLAIIVCLAAHVLLLPDGSWQLDEFVLLARVPDGWQDYLQRILGWSPRPFSEALLALYRHAVWASGRPLTVSMLAVCWAFPASAAVMAARLVPSRDPPLLAAGLLLSVVLLTVRPGEAFYWPAGAVAYLPTLGAMIYTCVMASRAGGWRCLAATPIRARVGLLLWLLVGATSSEIGAAFAVVLGVASLPFARRRAAWAWLPPVVVGVAVLLSFGTFRGHGTDVMAPDSASLHHLATSLAFALPDFLWEFVAGQWAGGGVVAVATCIAVRVAVFEVFLPSQPPAEKSLRATAENLVPCVALLAAGFATLLSAYFEFGMACCDRHATMRQAMFTLAVSCVAAVWPFSGRWRLSPHLRLPATCGLMSVLLLLRLPGLRHDFRMMHTIVETRAVTWASGFSAGEAMSYYAAPIPVVAAGAWGPPRGRYVLHDQADPHEDYGSTLVMRFFGKRSLTVR